MILSSLVWKLSIGHYVTFKRTGKGVHGGNEKIKNKDKIVCLYLSSSGSSSLSFNHITVGIKVESCFIIHSNETWPYL